MVGLSNFYKHTAAIAIRFLYRRHHPPVLVGKTLGVGRSLPLSTFAVGIQDAGGCLFKLSAATERWCCVNFEHCRHHAHASGFKSDAPYFLIRVDKTR